MGAVRKCTTNDAAWSIQACHRHTPLTCRRGVAGVPTLPHQAPAPRKPRVIAPGRGRELPVVLPGGPGSCPPWAAGRGRPAPSLNPNALAFVPKKATWSLPPSTASALPPPPWRTESRTRRRCSNEVLASKELPGWRRPEACADLGYLLDLMVLCQGVFNPVLGIPPCSC
eukprot:Sspe_Gene.104255::Locus_80270_Transcript_1_2_Confidence_0.600_Length_614::g.104255::m.104255